jgi:catechol 2,3-dioxygenase-like lactoylglutathione lyase family enzyme
MTQAVPQNIAPKYHSAVFFVSDVNRSKHFYNVVLGQKIVADFGANVGFEGGLGIWERNYALNTIYKENAKQVQVGGNNVEIYFESANLENLFENLVKQQVKVIHSIMEHPWGQRAFRIYDPDNHIIEIAESMTDVVLRLYNSGLSVEDIAKKSQMPVEFIKSVLQK